MPILRRIGRLAGTLLDQQLAQENQDHQSQLIAQRQREASWQASQASLLDQILKDPTGQMAEKLSQAGAQRVAGVPLSALLHDRNDAEGAVGGEIAKADSLDKLLTPSDIVSRYNDQAGASDAAPNGDNTTIQRGVPFQALTEDNQGGLTGVAGSNGLLPTPKESATERLMHQSATRMQTLKNATKPVEQTSYNDKGNKVKALVNPYAEQGHVVADEPTPEQAGVKKGAEAVAAAPGLGGAQALQNDITRPGEVKTAGQKAGAEARATGAAEIAKMSDPRYLTALTEKIRQEGIAKAAAEGAQEHAKLINSAATTVASITPDWAKMQALSAKVNTGAGRQLKTQYFDVPMQRNPDAVALDNMNLNMAKRLANDPLFGGNKGAQSERDSDAIAGRLPRSGDSQIVAQQKIYDFNDNLYKGLQAISGMPANASPQEKINIMRRAVGMDPIDLANPNPGPRPTSTAQEKRQKLIVRRPQ